MAVMVQGVRGAAVQNWQRLLGSASVRSLSSTNSRHQDPFQPQPVSSASSVPSEEEPVVHPKERKKLLVLGGSGFVGSHVCEEALSRGVPVLSLNRKGRPDGTEAWVNDVVWLRGDLFDPSQWRESLEEVQAVISCVGAFGTNEQMRRINGEANRTAVWAASKAGVKRFVYISVADFNLPSVVLRGYFEGKRLAEDAVRSKFPYSGVILRPGFIYGDRKIAGVKVPLGMLGSPLEAVMKQAKGLTQVPIVGPLLVPPVKVEAVAKAAVKAALGPVPPGVLDVWSIIRLGDH